MSSKADATAPPMPEPGDLGQLVVVASSNHGKLAEIRSALDFPGWRFAPAGELDSEWPSPEEDGETFEDNARIKARAARERFAFAALADDSGLEVDALDGAPGVYSSRFAGPCATDAENNSRLLLALQDVPEARAHRPLPLHDRPHRRGRGRDGRDRRLRGPHRLRAERRARIRLRPAVPARRDTRPHHGRAHPRREERDQPPRRGAARAESETGGGVADFGCPRQHPSLHCPLLLEPSGARAGHIVSGRSAAW